MSIEEELGNIRDTMLSFSSAETKNLDIHQISDLINFLFGIWCGEEEVQVNEVLKRNTILFGERSTILMRYRSYSILVSAISKQLDVLKQANSQVDKGIVDRIDRIAINIQYGYESMIYLYRQVFCNRPELTASLPPTRMDALFSPIVEDDMKTHQRLIRFLLEECNRRQYRKQGSALFAPLFTESGDFTRTYVHACEIIEFIYDAVYPYHQNIWLFSALTEKGGTHRLCYDYLLNCKDDNLPTLVKDRTKFAFQNGLFDARTNMFYPYGEDPGWDSRIVCANYLDTGFDHVSFATVDDPIDIECLHIQRILDSQNFEPEVCRWFYASVGRMVFDVGEIDNWQFFPFCKGTAGSGKSTIMRLASKMYNEIDVGNLMSEGSKSFSVEHLVDKYIFFCFDVDDKCTFSLTRWNQMVSGEPITIERKFKVPIQKNWSSAGAFSGNAFPPWVDQAGNISRRMLNFIFTQTIKDVDPNLFDKCLKEMGAFMKKCISCYFDLIEKFGDKGIWDNGVLPHYFHKTRRQMQAETNPLQAFLQDDQCILEVGLHIGFSGFRTAFYAFCDENRLPKRTLTKDFCSNVFDTMGIALVEVPPGADPLDHHDYTSKYITGVSLT
jgi:hypothetical protein